MAANTTIFLWLLKRTFLPIFVGFAVFSLLGTIFRVLSITRVSPTALEEIVIDHQQHAANNIGPRDFLLIGDSSCLMNVAVDQLQAERPQLSFQNLGMVSIMPLSSFAQLVVDHSTANKDSPKNVILIVHPEMLTLRPDPVPDTQITAPIQAERGGRQAILHATGVLHLFRSGFHALVPQLLPGRYGSFYGFNTTFHRFMADHNGSAIDPAVAQLPAIAPQTFAISDVFRSAASDFRSRIPAHAKLLLALSPVPESSAPVNYSLVHQELMAELLKLLKPDYVLELPPTLPAQFFSTTTHLRQEYRPYYTRLLNRELNQILKSR